MAVAYINEIWAGDYEADPQGWEAVWWSRLQVLTIKADRIGWFP